MRDLINFFLLKGFEISEENSSDKHFYMNMFIDGVYQIDAQGDDDYCTIRLIGKKHVEDLLDTNGLNDIDKIDRQIKEWMR